MKFYQIIEEEEIDEGVADYARNLKAKAGAAVQAVKSTLSRAKGKDDPNAMGGNAQIVKELDTLAGTTLSKANLAGRGLHANLVRSNEDAANWAPKFGKLMQQAAASMVAKYRKGAALIVEYDDATFTTHIFESPSLVKRYADPLITYSVITPLPEANATKGPYFLMTFDKKFNQRIVQLQRLQDSGARPVHPHQQDDERGSGPAAQAGGGSAGQAPTYSSSTAPSGGSGGGGTTGDEQPAAPPSRAAEGPAVQQLANMAEAVKALNFILSSAKKNNWTMDVATATSLKKQLDALVAASPKTPDAKPTAAVATRPNAVATRPNAVATRPNASVSRPAPRSKPVDSNVIDVQATDITDRKALSAK